MRLSNAEKNFSSHRKVQTLRISQADLVNDLDIFVKRSSFNLSWYYNWYAEELEMDDAIKALLNFLARIFFFKLFHTLFY